MLISVPVMFIAVRVAPDSARGIAEAEFPATFVVAGLGAELRAVKGSKEATAAHLTGDGCQGILRASGAGRGILRRVVHARAGAAVGVAHQHASKFIHGDVHEIEQIAAGIAASAVPDAAALNRVGHGGVHGGPGAAGVIGEGDVEVPNSGEVSRLVVAAGRGAEESEGGAIVVSGDDFGELCVLNAERCAGVFGFAPVSAAVVRDSNLGMAVTVGVAEIDGVVGARSDRRIAAGTLRSAVGHSLDGP